MPRFLSFPRTAAILLPLVLLFDPASARDWIVLPDGSGDAPTIQAAVDSTAAGDTVSLSAGVFTGAGNRDVFIMGPSVTIRSSGGDPSACVIDCGGEGRAFRIESYNGTFRIEGLTVRNGVAAHGGAIRLGAWPYPEKNGANEHPSLLIRDCLFSGNTTYGMGGAIYVGDESVLDVEDSEFHDNGSYDSGPYSAGGAICFRVLGPSSTVTLRRCVLADNFCDGPGGSLYIVNAHVLLEECDILDNRSGLSAVTQWPAGAGVMVRRYTEESPDMEVRVENCDILRNKAAMYPPDYASDGGGLMVKGHDAEHLVDLRVTDTRFEENFSAQGAGLYVGRYCNGLVERCRFRDNLAYMNGGGSYKGGALADCLGESVRFEFCEFVGNGAGFHDTGVPNRWVGNGGAFMTRLLPRGEFVNCSFSGNRTNDNGGFGNAIYHWAETGSFTDSSQRCLLMNCVFYGEEPGDVQVRADSDGFTTVAGCAWEPGEFSCQGVVPVDTVLLSGSPFLSADSLRLHDESPCIDRGIYLGITEDIEGAYVPQGTSTEVGAYEHPDSTFTGMAGDTAAPPPPESRLLIRPNPFNPSTSIAFDLAEPGPARLTVHDIAGRTVAVLADRVLPAGPREIAWDGRASSGRPLPSGIYLILLESGEETAVRKALLLR
ncbi:MAG: right-handed parallel beta-helix repeat-containing protein [Candidatus Eisenbacteria bacterium]|nr:right-handed parallel beta-helix repeat-containing protein [Candidatus Eisenbacteria bacterium]